MWLHFRSDAMDGLLEKFTGFVRVPLEDADGFQKWYDDIVENQVAATTAGNRARAGFLSKKKTKVLRYALPQTFLEQFFHRHAARLREAEVPDVRNSIGAAGLQVAAALLDFMDAQRPHFQTLSGQSYASPPPLQACSAPSAPEVLVDTMGVTFPDVALLDVDRIPQIVAADSAAFVTAAAAFLNTKKTIVALKDIHTLWRDLPDALARRVSKVQNAALSTLTVFQALAVTENARGPKITKICRFPLGCHLNAAASATAPPFSTHDACNLVVNAAAIQPPCILQWPTGPTVAKDLAQANVPQNATAHSDSKVAAARSLLRELRLIFADHPPNGAPWAPDGHEVAEALPKRPRANPPAVLPLMHIGRGIAPPPAPTAPLLAEQPRQ